jgi:hypothetical protein
MAKKQIVPAPQTLEDRAYGAGATHGAHAGVYSRKALVAAALTTAKGARTSAAYGGGFFAGFKAGWTGLA